MLYLPIKAYSHEMRIEQVLNIQSMSWKTAADRNWISSECSTSKETWLSESFTNLFKTVVHLDVSQQNPSFIKKYKHQKFRSMNQELSCLGGWVFAWRDFLELGWRTRGWVSSKTTSASNTASQITAILQQHLRPGRTYSYLKAIHC